MREILFRAKRLDNREWAEGLPSYNINGDVEEIEVHRGFCDCDTYEIDPETVCEYTGLTDKNGKKVFEGDIVKIPYEHMEDNVCEVIFRSGMFIGETVDGCEDSIVERGIEVIGNIFDNLEFF